jgi:cytochrome c biogenesis protein CcmG, thiol:disulfide interchange protein DsbE
VALLSPRWRGALAGTAVITMMAVPAQAGTLQVGDPAPPLALPAWHDGSVRLGDLRGKVVVLDFWASWCVPCKTALPALDALARRQRTAGVVVLAVSIDRSRSTAERFLAETLPDPTLTVLQDPGGRAFAALGPAGTPALYVIDPQGIVRMVEAGYAPERIEAVERLVRELAAQSPEPRATP